MVETTKPDSKWTQDLWPKAKKTPDEPEQLSESWYCIRTDLFHLVVRPVKGGWDYRVQLYGPTNPHALVGNIYLTLQEAQQRCLKTAIARLQTEINTLTPILEGKL